MVDDKLKRQRKVIAKIETMDRKILQSYQQVGIMRHPVINVLSFYDKHELLCMCYYAVRCIDCNVSTK